MCHVQYLKKIYIYFKNIGHTSPIIYAESVVAGLYMNIILEPLPSHLQMGENVMFPVFESKI